MGSLENRHSDEFLMDALKQMANPMHIVTEHMEKMLDTVEQINNMNNISNIITNNRNMQQPVYNTFNITMPNVTDSTRAEELMNDLQTLSLKKFQVNW